VQTPRGLQRRGKVAAAHFVRLYRRHSLAAEEEEEEEQEP
jgi:hypothetical protein